MALSVWHSLPGELVRRIANLAYPDSGALLLLCKEWSKEVVCRHFVVDRPREWTPVLELVGDSLVTKECVMDATNRDRGRVLMRTDGWLKTMSSDGLILLVQQGEIFRWHRCRSPADVLECPRPLECIKVWRAKASNKWGVAAIECGMKLWVSVTAPQRFVEVDVGDDRQVDRLLAFSSDGERLITTWSRSTIGVLRTADPTAPPRLVNVDPPWLKRVSSYFNVRVSPCGNIIVGDGRAVSIRDETAVVMWTYSHTDITDILQFFADSTKMLTSRFCDRVNITDVSTGRTTSGIRIFSNGRPFFTHDFRLSGDELAIRFVTPVIAARKYAVYELPIHMFSPDDDGNRFDILP